MCKWPLLGVLDAEHVCPSVVPLFGDSVLDVLSNDLLTQLRFCSEFLGVCKNPHFYTLSLEDYKDRVLLDKPSFIKDDNYINTLYKEI